MHNRGGGGGFRGSGGLLVPVLTNEGAVLVELGGVNVPILLQAVLLTPLWPLLHFIVGVSR